MSEMKAEVEGLEEIKEEEKPMDREALLDELLKMTDLTLTKEVRGDALSAYDKSGMYNLPFWTPEERGGKIEWKECDYIPGGCEYKKKKQAHTHQIDVGIRGAEYAMQVYGYIAIMQKEPKIIDVEGQKFWLSEMTFRDEIKHIEFNDFFMSPMMKKTHKGIIFDEYSFSIAISKCMRKGILRLIPGALRAKWIKAYREGQEDVFTKASVQEFQKERVKEYAQEKPSVPSTKIQEEPNYEEMPTDEIPKAAKDINDKLLAQAHAIASRKGKTHEDMRAWAAKRWEGFESMTKLTNDQLRVMITALNKLPDADVQDTFIPDAPNVTE